MRAVAVIPARMGSSRFPGKLLTSVGGEPLVAHVWRRLQRCTEVEAVIVATDDDEIAAVARSAGAVVHMAVGHYRCGTDRVAAVAAGIDAEFFVNVQADCAELDPGIVDQVVVALRDQGHPVVTPVVPTASRADVANPDLVKVVSGLDGRALYFSRSPIPASGPWLRHVGIYGFQRDVLAAFAQTPPSSLEVAEDLEQLRLLQNNVPIFTLPVEYAGVSIDSPADLQRVQTSVHTYSRGSHA